MKRDGRVILKHDISIVENSPGYDYVYVINPLGTVKQNVSPGDLLLNYLVPGGYTVHFYIVPFLQFSRYLILHGRPRVSKIGVYLLLLC